MSRKHRCFHIDAGDGVEARVHGDPNMSAETREALIAVVRAAYKKLVEEGNKTESRAKGGG